MPSRARLTASDIGQVFIDLIRSAVDRPDDCKPIQIALSSPTEARTVRASLSRCCFLMSVDPDFLNSQPAIEFRRRFVCRIKKNGRIITIERRTSGPAEKAIQSVVASLTVDRLKAGKTANPR